MKVQIYTGFFRHIFFNGYLTEIGFRLKKENNKKFWQKHIDDEKHNELKNIRKFCRKNCLKYRFIDDSMERSTNYRNRFFKEKKGILGTGIYVCAYCGRFMTKKKVRVDHIIPVYKAKNDKFYRKLLSLQNIKNVNDIRNLTASCEKCNSKKSAKGGFWIIRGWFGRSSFRVILKEAIFLILGSAVLYYLYIVIREYASLDFICQFCENFKKIL